ncbi:hypothetical protein GCM10009020_35520 [Natronoarchaeum mannanilyticum]|uniref:DUF3850 domain-containing protein n=1 Tax=Natronoarchaeum mannanilyticum TaxID=926360 RepID=A0AAV3TDU0_9EURY
MPHMWTPDAYSEQIKRREGRHFFHIGATGQDGGSGGGGTDCESVAESDKHLKWKSLAADQLETIFEDPHHRYSMERELAAPKSEKDKRVGDVVLRFEEPDRQFGKGIVAEVQHRNESKDIHGRLLTISTRDIPSFGWIAPILGKIVAYFQKLISVFSLGMPCGPILYRPRGSGSLRRKRTTILTSGAILKSRQRW